MTGARSWNAAAIPGFFCAWCFSAGPLRSARWVLQLSFRSRRFAVRAAAAPPVRGIRGVAGPKARGWLDCVAPSKRSRVLLAFKTRDCFVLNLRGRVIAPAATVAVAHLQQCSARARLWEDALAHRRANCSFQTDARHRLCRWFPRHQHPPACRLGQALAS